MTTIYECDITGEQYRDSEQVREVSLCDEHGVWAIFEFGPDAAIDEVRERLHEMVDEFQPFHQAWYDDRTDDYTPPRIDPETITAETYEITIPVVTYP